MKKSVKNAMLPLAGSMLIAINVFAQKGAKLLPYQDPKASVETRTKDLLERMTLEEKVAQLKSSHPGRPRLDDKLFSNKAKLDSIYGKGIGMVNPAFDESMDETIAHRNRLKDYLLHRTRLGIPTIFIDEAHHGLVQKHVDVYPHGIGMACSWDTSLMIKIYDHIARQASSRGTNLVLAPVVDVARDPRWGRTGETWGEDPFLNGMIGTAVVTGLQGSTNGLIAPNHVASTLKHFTGHGQPESGDNTGPANYSVRALREFHMEPFRLVINNAKPAAIMPSYNEVDEIPSHANKWLLTDVLKNEWHYKGILVSDWFAIDQLITKHHIATDVNEAAQKAFDAGVTIDLPYGVNYQHLIELTKSGKISMAAIDSAVAKILRLKFQMGLFEGKDIDIKKAIVFNQAQDGRKLALKIAQESMVLLKNENHVLPIKKDQYKNIAVIGPFGNTNYLGDYSGVPSKNVSIIQGLKNKLGSMANISYAQGVKMSSNGDTISQNNYQFIDALKLPDKTENQRLISEAVDLAKKADFIILAVGENEQFSREAWDNHWGDMISLDLQSQQQELVEAVAATGKPYLVYLMHGRPLSVNWIAKNAHTIVDGWFTGEESGNAFASLLVGDINPSGKLPISIPRSVGQLPIFYNHQPSSKYYEYVTEKNTPLYPFGYGLSYSTFLYGKPVLKDSILSVDITNTGTMKGDEIVQLYIHQKSGNSVVRPVRELKGFSRISLNPGEKRTTTFVIDRELLMHWTADMKYIAEPGIYELMVGANSQEVQTIDYTIK